ncbi:MAG TPA: tRNA-binding protein [Flavipsychrobacter sp.]|nr:tRNA-binding protein [Flavipsychrobacter sp.]
MISWEDFEKVDIRTGTILKASVFPKAKKAAFKLEIDFGDIGIKRSSAQITELYTIHELVGKQIVAVVNFPPKRIGSFVSEVLVLGVIGAREGVVLLEPNQKVMNGLKIA